MQKSSEHTLSASQFWRIAPAMLGALLVVLLAVDALLAYQPAILKDLSSAWQSLVTMQPVLAPSANVLAATLAIASVVIASAVLLVFARATAGAAHLSLTTTWVAFCMLVVAAIPTPLPLPMSTPLFAGLCALLFVGAGMLLRLGSWAGAISGWCSIALPFVLVTDGYVRAPRTEITFGRDACELLLWLGLSAVGVVLIAYARPRGQSASGAVDGLEGVDVVEALFEQVERAERSEARVAELERQLNHAYAHRRAS
jgi:hypothetical protein